MKSLLLSKYGGQTNIKVKCTGVFLQNQRSFFRIADTYIPKFTRESPLPGCRNQSLLLPLKNISFKIKVVTFLPPHPSNTSPSISAYVKCIWYWSWKRMLLPGKVAEGLGLSAPFGNHFSQWRQRYLSATCNAPCNCHTPDHSKPLFLMTLSHGVPKVWWAFQLLMFSCLKLRSWAQVTFLACSCSH